MQPQFLEISIYQKIKRYVSNYSPLRSWPDSTLFNNGKIISISFIWWYLIITQPPCQFKNSFLFTSQTSCCTNFFIGIDDQFIYNNEDESMQYTYIFVSRKACFISVNNTEDTYITQINFICDEDGMKYLNPFG